MKNTLIGVCLAALLSGAVGGCSPKTRADDATRSVTSATAPKPAPVAAALPEKYEKVNLAKAGIQLDIRQDAGGGSVLIMPSGPGETASTGGQMCSGTVKTFRIHGRDIALDTNVLGVQSHGEGDAHTVISTTKYGEIRITFNPFKQGDPWQLWMTAAQKAALDIP